MIRNVPTFAGDLKQGTQWRVTYVNAVADDGRVVHGLPADAFEFVPEGEEQGLIAKVAVVGTGPSPVATPATAAAETALVGAAAGNGLTVDI